MSHIVANLPPVKCFVRKEFLYDFEKGHGELEPCWWISIKSLRGQAFRIEAYLNNYGALYDKLPLHAFCWKPIDGEPLPLDYLQLWDCLSYDVTVLKMPDFKVATKRWSVETDPKWALGDTNAIMYEETK
jgi:hypothetical protein